MIAAGALIQATDDNLAEITGSERGVLILAKSDCGYCAAYQQDIERLLEQLEDSFPSA